MQKLIVYSKNYCPYCVMVKNLLTSLQIEYDEVDITKTPEIIVELIKKSGMRTVPQVFLGDECLGGYDNIAKLHEEGKLFERIAL